MSLRCEYCDSLIIDKFTNNYTKMDYRKKDKHERHCSENPNNLDKYDAKQAILRARKRAFGAYEFEESERRFQVIQEWREENE